MILDTPTSSTTEIIGSSLPHIPWLPRPANATEHEVVWRYTANPVVPRNAIPSANSIFNSAVVPFGEGFAGVFRCDYRDRYANLHVGFSPDGIKWTINPGRIHFINGAKDPEISADIFAYDPRVVCIDGRYHIIWCNAYHGSPVISLGYTDDFKTFTQSENAFLPFNRNGVLFPRKINGNYLMLSRPSDNGHTPFGDIYLSESPDLTYWGKHRFVMGRRGCWEGVKIGAGSAPIETSEGWLLFYHGVLHSCNGYVYSMGAALLDLDKPSKVIARCKNYLLSPQAPYEQVGDVNNVVFPCAALADADTGRIAIYYGSADTVTSLAFCEVDSVVRYIKQNSEL
ncbi:MAG: glycoside hydrolase family 130 protein [Opitutaceae bacterium]|jgi:beta-1,4-mannooligosaccharide/beta-1,4-mannosyl-N-acetylglucosamine phosphorylase